MSVGAKIFYRNVRFALSGSLIVVDGGIFLLIGTAKRGCSGKDFAGQVSVEVEESQE